MRRSFFASPPCTVGAIAGGAYGIWWKWQRVLLKQPAVPLAGEGGLTSELAPPVWQMAQVAAFRGSVLVWVEAPAVLDVQGLAGWGEDTSSPWQPLMLVQDGGVPLLKVEP